jgi:hypothetical protein
MSVVQLPQPKQKRVMNQQTTKPVKIKKIPPATPKIPRIKLYLSAIYEFAFLVSEKLKELVVWGIALLVVALLILYLLLLHERAFPKFHAQNLKAHQEIVQEICEGYVPPKRKE